MKSFFETLFISAALAFVGWGTINVGMKFEVKINGEEWGFTIGGPSEKQRAMLMYMNIYNGYLDPYYAWADRYLADLLMKLPEPVKDELFREMYPQFESINLVGASENSQVFFIVCSGKRILDIESAIGMEIQFNTKSLQGYTVL